METLTLYSLRDRIAQSFRSVVLDTNDATARRSFAYAVNNDPQLLYQSKDLELYAIAEFDTKSGKITPIVPNRLVTRGDEVVDEK